MKRSLNKLKALQLERKLSKMIKYQILCDIGNDQWQVIGIEDYFYPSYEEAQKSLQQTLEDFGEDATHYKIVEVIA